jgi:hypothetical protein
LNAFLINKNLPKHEIKKKRKEKDYESFELLDSTEKKVKIIRFVHLVFIV